MDRGIQDMRINENWKERALKAESENKQLQAQVEDLTHYSEAVAEVVNENTFEKIRAEYNLRAALNGDGSGSVL